MCTKVLLIRMVLKERGDTDVCSSEMQLKWLVQKVEQSEL